MVEMGIMASNPNSNNLRHPQGGNLLPQVMARLPHNYRATAHLTSGQRIHHHRQEPMEHPPLLQDATMVDIIAEQTMDRIGDATELIQCRGPRILL
jgi:hypothetical protein